MIKDEESSSLTRRYYRCKQSETGVSWGGKGGRASTCDARDTGAKEGSGGRGDGRVFPLTPTQMYAVSSRVVLPVQLPRRLPPPLFTACSI